MPAKEKENLKDVLAKLDKIVADLNSKDVDVEKGLEKFKEGVALVKTARERLKKAENEFISLKEELEEDSE
jgi:exodeoxyribonuclease VII small subunit